MNDSSARKETIRLMCGEKTTTAEILISVPSTGERVGKAIGLGIALLVATAIAALIPLVHFIAVPIGLIVLVTVVISTLKRKEIIDSGSGPCPGCGASFRIMRRKYGFPFQDVCEQCGRAVVVQKG